MRSSKLLLVISGLLALQLASAPHPAVAQCASSVYTAVIHCHTQSCSNSATQVIPTFEQYGAIWFQSGVTCCGIFYPSYYSLGQGCPGNAQLADPSVRQHLIELAKYQGVMVATCGGEFRPLAVALSQQPAGKADERPDLFARKRTLPGIEGGGQ